LKIFDLCVYCSLFCDNLDGHKKQEAAGPLTSLDHLPVIITITTPAIKVSKEYHLDFEKADWIVFKNKRIDYVTENTSQNNLTNREIDREAERWYKAVKDAAVKSIPKTTGNTTQKE